MSKRKRKTQKREGRKMSDLKKRFKERQKRPQRFNEDGMMSPAEFVTWRRENARG